MMSGLGRCIGAIIFVRIMGWGVTGAMAAVLLAAAAPLLVCLWQTYADWHGPASRSSGVPGFGVLFL